MNVQWFRVLLQHLISVLCKIEGMSKKNLVNSEILIISYIFSILYM